MIDFDNLPVLIGPRRKRILAERYDREKLAQSHMRRAKGPKKHSTNKERSYHDRERARRIKYALIQQTAEREAFHAAVLAYWRGERDEYPESQ